jgi:Zn-dependent M32 family carboxypeptidase
MTFEHLSKWLTLTANLAVLAGIGLLVFELQQNRAMISAQTRSQISSELINLLSQVATDPQLANLVRRADDGEDLTPDEEKQYGHRSAAMFRFFENVHYQYRQGLYDEFEYQAHREAWRGFFKSSATAAKNWCIYREVVSPNLKAEIDSLIDESVCAQV